MRLECRGGMGQMEDNTTIFPCSALNGTVRYGTKLSFSFFPNRAFKHVFIYLSLIIVTFKKIKKRLFRRSFILRTVPYPAVLVAAGTKNNVCLNVKLLKIHSVVFQTSTTDT